MICNATFGEQSASAEALGATIPSVPSGPAGRAHAPASMFCGLAAALAMTAGSARAEIIHVPEDYPTIREAINASQNGDEIIVAPGVYHERISLSDHAITVRSADPDDRSVVEATIIDGEGDGTVIYCDGYDGWPAFTISGFTITNGWNHDSGGGMYNRECTPTVTKCIFENNMAYWGGGGMCNVASSPTITDCTFINNSDHYYSGEGGAMWNRGTNVTVTRCRFIANVAEIGGAISSSEESTITLTDCTFMQNSADYGAGAFNDQYCSVVLMNCTFYGNGAVYAGGLYTGSQNATVMNCTFSGNFAGAAGGGLTASIGLDMANCTFIGNVAEQGGGATFYEYHGAELTAANCIFWGNQAAEGSQIFESGTSPEITYSCIEDGHPGTGNIDADPLLKRAPNPGPDEIWGTDDDDYGNLHVLAGSPCIDAADNTAVPPDLLDLDNDGDTDEPTPLDLDHLDRFVDDPHTPDTGFGDPPIVDMGAYEFQAPDCPADFDGDGDVDTVDLLFLLGAWGTPDGDVDGDGDTDTADLLALLGAWGPCPPAQQPRRR